VEILVCCKMRVQEVDSPTRLWFLITCCSYSSMKAFWKYTESKECSLTATQPLYSSLQVSQTSGWSE
jgi:hypothetical protein